MRLRPVRGSIRRFSILSDIGTCPLCKRRRALTKDGFMHPRHAEACVRKYGRGMSEKTLGQVGFDAYGEHANWTAYDGKPMPRWDDSLRADIKEKWEVAAKAIAKKAVDDYVKSQAEASDPD